jgi:hypothetical protein
MNAVHQTARPTPIASTPPAIHGQAVFTGEGYRWPDRPRVAARLSVTFPWRTSHTGPCVEASCDTTDRVYAQLVDVRQLARRISAEPATAFAVGALVVDLAVLALPLNDGSSQLSYVLGVVSPLRVKLAYLLTVLARAVAILIGLVLLRRGRTSMASGVFVGLLVVLGLSVISSVLTSIDGWLWQAAVVLGLQTVECVLLFLAVRAARQHRTDALR